MCIYRHKSISFCPVYIVPKHLPYYENFQNIYVIVKIVMIKVLHVYGRDIHLCPQQCGYQTRIHSKGISRQCNKFHILHKLNTRRVCFTIYSHNKPNSTDFIFILLPYYSRP